MTHPTRRYWLRIDDMQMPHSGLCDARGPVRDGDGWLRPGACTCGAGLLRLLAGAR